MKRSEHLSRRRIAVIGSGPIGLEAALQARTLGADVRVYEAGTVAQNVSEWGHIELFTPFGMNHTRLGRQTLESAGHVLPDDDAFQTGAEWRETYLLPLAEKTELADCLRTRTRVVTISRDSLLKHEHIGDGVREERPFRLLIEEGGSECYEEADIVFDCSGTWSNPNWLGAGGTPALGERAARPRIAYHPVDIFAQRARFAGRRTLLVGDGLSAATTAVALAELAAEAPDTRYVWATRGCGPAPIAPIPDDPLARRAALTEAANRIALQSKGGVTWMPDTSVRAIHWKEDEEGFAVTLATSGGEREDRFDEVIANVGYEPDDSLYRQLQVHECYASRAPMKLAASLLAASAGAGGDCLQLGGFGPDVLVTPERGFFILGMKSYGRNSAFLLRTGHEQVRDAFVLLTGRSEAVRSAGLELE